MATGDLNKSLLLDIMVRLGQLRERRDYRATQTNALMHLVSPEFGPGQARLAHLNRHVNFLHDIGLLTVKPAGVFYRSVQLTAKGQIFVQPELASFENQEMWPEVLKVLEKNIQVLTYPQDEKDGMLYRLREAIAKQAPDMIAKVIAEVGVKIAAGR
jgi:hypothetical protein